MKKKFLALALTAVMALSLAACGGDTQSTDTDADTSGDESASGSQTYTVGIIQQVQHEALDAATQGFQDALTELLGDSVTIDPQNASGDTANCTTIANNFVSQGVDLIMANGTTALQAAATGTSTIPILGTSITEYGVAKLRQRTVKQRVENLIAVAHPDFRAELRKEANKYMYF